MKRLALWLIFLAVSAFASDLQPAKVLDVRPFSSANAPIIAPNNGHPVLISGGASYGFTLTVAIGDMAYSADFGSGRHFHSSDVTVGDTIPAKLDEKNRLIIRTPNGKELKSWITRKERITHNQQLVDELVEKYK